MEISLRKAEERLDNKSSLIARNIKSLRKNCGKTQQDLAIGVFMDKSRISDIENGRAGNLTLFTLIKFAEYFDCRVCDLFREWR